MLTPDNVRRRHARKRGAIRRRLEEFGRVPAGGDAALLSELAFCISAANSSAQAASRAQEALEAAGLLASDQPERIAAVMRASGVRFHNNKARYLVQARRHLFDGGGLERARAEQGHDPIALRDRLAGEVAGLGLKEAGHFLRNAGLASEFAILDRHILKNLASLGVIARPPRSLTPKRYRAIEARMGRFCRESGIPMAHLDLLMWSEQTGRIFK